MYFTSARWSAVDHGLVERWRELEILNLSANQSRHTPDAQIFK
ncbi:hypothetical protein OKW34_005275 [Paraburkholderia youngii]